MYPIDKTKNLRTGSVPTIHVPNNDVMSLQAAFDEALVLIQKLVDQYSQQTSNNE